jgi:hypothetical protein
MDGALPTAVEASDELLGVLRAQRTVTDAEAATGTAQRLLARALREAGAAPEVVRMVEGAERPSLVPASLPVPDTGVQADEVVRVQQHALVEAIVAHLTALDALDMAEQRLDGVLPPQLRGARPFLRRLAVTGQPVHDFAAVTAPNGDLLAGRAVCGRPRTLAHRRVADRADAVVAADGTQPPPARCADCRELRTSDGPFAPEVGPIAQIARSASAEAEAAEPEVEARQSDRPSPGARPTPAPRPASTAAARSQSFGERHPRVRAAAVALRTIVVLIIVVLVFAGAVAGITGHLGLLEGLIH